jgi:hypothetical protein
VEVKQSSAPGDEVDRRHSGLAERAAGASGFAATERHGGPWRKRDLHRSDSLILAARLATMLKRACSCEEEEEGFGLPRTICLTDVASIVDALIGGCRYATSLTGIEV